MTLQEVADEMGCSVFTVWELQNKAVKKIRRVVLRHDITYEELLLCIKNYL